MGSGSNFANELYGIPNPELNLSETVSLSRSVRMSHLLSPFVIR